MAKPIRQLDDEALERPFNRGQLFRTLAYLKPYLRQVRVSVGLMLVSTFAGIAVPFLMSRVIGDLQKGGGHAPWLILLMVLISGIGTFCFAKRVRLMDHAGRSALTQLRVDLMAHIQTLSFSFFDTRSAGKILVRVINDVNELDNLFSNGLINMLIDCLTVVLLTVVMLSVNWQLTLIGLCILPALILIVFKLRRVMRKRWQVVRAKRSNMNGYLHESLSGVRVTQAFVREEENSQTFREVNDDIRNSWMRAVRLNSLFWPALDMTGAVGTVLVYFFGVKLLGASVALPDLLLVLWYLDRFWQPLNNISTFYNNLLSASASMERIFEIMDIRPDIEDAPDAIPCPPVVGELRFQNVSFSYVAGQEVLHKVSFVATPGQSIALVGATGSGKSTIVNLISRFYDVTGGEILLDGQDLRGLQLNSLRRQMSVMQQDSFIFAGNILENIRYGRLDATDEEVIAAAKAVYAHEFIEKMPQGYRTEVNERGSSLSTGQKQLISFARALLNDPRILILDEATSSIDTHTEMLIQKALDVLLRGRTSFVIAHRLSTIRNADQILVIENGEIAERGSHEELIALKGGHYRALCEAQYRFMEAV